MLIRLLIYFILGIIIHRVLRKLFSGPKKPRVQTGGRMPLKADDTMVQDPQCGTYIARRDGETLRIGGQTLYFCSESCKAKYVARQTPKP
ncbi:MAG: YHS domain-containing protein [Desulfatitalea sp.]|nr:YHS domain-containing protein [Desulfatitalea sp.]NNK02432.1 YHS domain-containing protein [Desulfatitalea sp.]